MPQVVILQKEAPKIRLIDVDITTNRVNLNNVTPKISVILRKEDVDGVLTVG